MATADIPPRSDYEHWNEERDQMWWAENRYDMYHWDEPQEPEEYFGPEDFD